MRLFCRGLVFERLDDLLRAVSLISWTVELHIFYHEKNPPSGESIHKLELQ